VFSGTQLWNKPAKLGLYRPQANVALNFNWR